MSTEYLRRNLEVCKAVGANANAKAAIERLLAMKHKPVWMLAAIEGIRDRTEGLSKELAKWRNTAPDAPAYASQRTEQQADPWRQAVDEALIAHALDCTGPGDDPKEKVKELIEWAVTIATDPRVSGQAAIALQPSARAEPVLGPNGSADRYFYEAGFRACQRAASPVTAAREQEAACSVIADCSTPTLCLSVGTCKGVHVMPASVRASATGAEPVAWLAENQDGSFDAYKDVHSLIDDCRQGFPVYATPTTSTTGKVDVEQMLRDCVPGGSSCDPQAICDDIRAWFANGGNDAK